MQEEVQMSLATAPRPRVLGRSMIEAGALVHGHRVVRELQPRAAWFGDAALSCERWLVLEPRELADRTLVVMRPLDGVSVDLHAAADHLHAVGDLDSTHVLPYREVGVYGDEVHAVAPYTGSHDGLLTLDELLAIKGGRMAAYEAERVVEQLLDAATRGHQRGLVHGPVGLDEVLVDRRGSLRVELYGLAAAGASGRRGPGELPWDEVRSIAQIAYRLLTGIPADEPLVPAARLVRRLSGAWTAWLERGLDPATGFVSAAEATRALPSRAATGESEAGRALIAGIGRVVPRGGWRRRTPGSSR